VAAARKLRRTEGIVGLDRGTAGPRSIDQTRSGGHNQRPVRAEQSLAERLDPSTTSAWPVTHSESSLARNNAIAAMSSGSPVRG